MRGTWWADTATLSSMHWHGGTWCEMVERVACWTRVLGRHLPPEGEGNERPDHQLLQQHHCQVDPRLGQPVVQLEWAACRQGSGRRRNRSIKKYTWSCTLCMQDRTRILPYTPDLRGERSNADTNQATALRRRKMMSSPTVESSRKLTR